MYSIHVDWSEYNEKWENKGRQVIEEDCKHYTQDDDGNTNDMQYQGYCEKCGHYEDSGHPMMNYAYPLECEPDDAKIRKVLDKTNCTIMYNNDENTYYLALTGGGMDLSQDIARAYQICETWVPRDLLTNVSTQPELSVHGTEWLKMARMLKKQAKMEAERFRSANKEWNNAIQEYNKRHRKSSI